jgi:hypothetical protein
MHIYIYSIGMASRTVHGATMRRSAEKRRKYASELSQHNILFTPLSVSVLGAWDPEAVRLFKRLGGMIANRSGDQVKNSTSMLLTRVSFALQRSNG